MHLTLWAFVPLLTAPLAAIALVASLQRLLSPRNERLQQSTVTWDTVTACWPQWVTRVLPVPVGIALILLVAWPFAYLGWFVIYLSDDPTALSVMPPWFGNPAYMLMYALAGAVMAIAVLMAGIALTFVAHFIGKCTIWPDTCGCTDSEDGQSGANGSTTEERR